MKKIKYILLSCITLFIIGCNPIGVEADEEVVLVKKPWFFGHGGIDEDPVNSGRVICAMSTSGVVFKVTPITYTEKFDDMMSDDNTPVDFSAFLKLRIQKGKTPFLLEKFGEQWYANSVKETFRAMVRDKASTYKMFDLAGNREVLGEIDREIFQKISEYVKQLGLPVEVLQVTIGAVTPPSEVLDETKRTAAQNQSELTQNARAKAELSRKQAEINKAKADKAYRNEMGMSMNEYLRMRELEIEKEKVELVKDRDKANISIIMGNATPMYNVK